MQSFIVHFTLGYNITSQVQIKDSSGRDLYYVSGHHYGVPKYTPAKEPKVIRQESHRKMILRGDEESISEELAESVNNMTYWEEFPADHTITKMVPIQDSVEWIDSTWVEDKDKNLVTFTTWDTPVLCGVGKGGRLAPAGFVNRKRRVRLGFEYWELTVSPKEYLEHLVSGLKACEEHAKKYNYHGLNSEEKHTILHVISKLS